MTMHTDDVSARIAFSILTEPGSAELPGFVAACNGDWARALLRVISGHGPVEWQSRVPDLLEQVDQVEGDIARFNINLVIPGDDAWPIGLNDLESPPPVLYVRGNVALLNSGPAVCVTGTRASSGYGEHVAMEFVAQLVDRDVTIVNGGNHGIDQSALRAALAAGSKPVALMSGGVDRFYPAGYSDLLRRVAEVGAVISEIPPGSPASKWRFDRRAQLLAAVTSATVIVEAGRSSSALAVASHARVLGRGVGAVPGPVTSTSSVGANALIRSSAATLVTNVQEAYALLGL
jgi:DNA processing protein